MSFVSTSTDSWESYYTESNGKGHGKGHDKPPKHPVPEPSTYGLLLTAICLVVIICLKRRAAKKLGITCGCGGCGKKHGHRHNK